MKRTEKLAHELMLSVFGEPWRGPSLKDNLRKIKFEQAFQKPIPAINNIIELTLHMNAWTKEALSRIEGNSPAEPEVGDWPTPLYQTDKYWQLTIEDLFADTNKLITAIKNFPEEKLNEVVGNERNASLGTGFFFEGLINGLIQHNVYHPGQIALI